MALRHFRNHTQEWLEARFFELSTDLANGKAILSTSAGDTSATFSAVGSVSRSLADVVFELHVRDPEKWPADMLYENRTRVTFS